MLCTERQGADGFNQIDRLASGHERNRLAVHCGKAVLTVAAVERQRERREVFVWQMQRQRNFLLSGGYFVREAARRQGAKCIAEIEDVKALAVIAPSPFRVRIVLVLGRRISKRVGFAFQGNYVFQGRPLATILAKYKREVDVASDEDGKKLYGVLVNELRSIRKDREDLVEIVVKYLMETDQALVDALATYLSKKVSDN